MVLSGWEAVFFWVFALSALVAGLLTVMARNAVHSAMFLISTLVSVAALFVLLGARDAARRPAETGVAKSSEDTQRVGGSLYRYGGLPFEIASVLLLVAIVGSVLLARTAKQELAADDVDPRVVEELEATGELTPAEVEEALHAHDVKV